MCIPAQNQAHEPRRFQIDNRKRCRRSICTTRRSANDVRAAYTLVEMVLVVLISGVLVAAGIPRYTDSLFQFRVDAASKRLAADITFAQRQALTRSMSLAIQVTPAAGPGTPNSYTMPLVKYVNFAAAGVIVNLSQDPYSVVISSATFGGSTTLTFDRYGSPSNGGTVVLQAGSYQKTVTVSSSTGRVTIQ